jgi:hypothetical protein
MQTRNLRTKPNGRRLAPALTGLATAGVMVVGFTQLGGASALTPSGGGSCGGGPSQTVTLAAAGRAGVALGQPTAKPRTVTVTRTKTVTKWKTVHKCHTVTATYTEPGTTTTHTVTTTEPGTVTTVTTE